MKTVGLISLLAAAAAFITGAVHAQSPELTERMASQAAQLIKHANETNEKCSTSMTVAFDWTGVKSEKDLGNHSASGYCDGALEGLRRVCGEQVGKDAVKEQIKSVTCGFGASREISLKDGALNYKINFHSTNDADFVYEYLENSL